MKSGGAKETKRGLGALILSNDRHPEQRDETGGGFLCRYFIYLFIFLALLRLWRSRESPFLVISIRREHLGLINV